jgi:hypothetical protein
MPTFCSRCGAAVKPDARFCEECGAQVNGKAAAGIPRPKRTPLLLGLSLAVALGGGALLFFVKDLSKPRCMRLAQ